MQTATSRRLSGTRGFHGDSVRCDAHLVGQRPLQGLAGVHGALRMHLVRGCRPVAGVGGHHRIFLDRLAFHVHESQQSRWGYVLCAGPRDVSGWLRGKIEHARRKVQSSLELDDI